MDAGRNDVLFNTNLRAVATVRAVPRHEAEMAGNMPVKNGGRSVDTADESRVGLKAEM